LICLSDLTYCLERSVKELQVTSKTDVFAFGVVLAELITGQRALLRDNRESTKMKSLITVVSFTHNYSIILNIILAYIFLYHIYATIVNTNLIHAVRSTKFLKIKIQRLL
jgi:hypothetical protein